VLREAGGLMLAVVVLATAVVSATFEKNPDVLEIGKIRNDEIRKVIEKPLGTGN